jgi:hypothetical protein
VLHQVEEVGVEEERRLGGGAEIGVVVEDDVGGLVFQALEAGRGVARVGVALQVLQALLVGRVDVV